MQRGSSIVWLLLAALWVSPAEAAKPKPNPTAPPLPPVNADQLPAGQFAGTLVSLPNSERMFTLKITYPELRLKPGAKMPNLRNQHAQNMNRMYQQMHQTQQVHHGRGRQNAASHAMQMQQAFMQNEQRMAQVIARAQQQELRLLQQEIKAIQNMYQVVQITRNVDFQLGEEVKVRINYLPEQFDDKGNIKKYTRQELLELKGKDKNLMGYESSADALQMGQIVVVALRVHKKPKPAATLATASVTDKAKDKDNDADKDKDSEATIQHKMQVKIIVILKDSDPTQNTTTKPTRKK